LQDVKQLKSFDRLLYVYSEVYSSETNYVFIKANGKKCR